MCARWTTSAGRRRDVTRATGLDREQKSASIVRTAAIAKFGAYVQAIADRQGSRRTAALGHVELPQQLSGGRIVGSKDLAASDQFVAEAVFPDDWRAVLRGLVAIDTPELFSGRRVQTPRETTAVRCRSAGTAFRRTASGNWRCPNRRASRKCPDPSAIEVPRQVVTVEPRHAEVGVDPLAVGYGRFGGVAVRTVPRNGGLPGSCRFPPHELAGLGIQAEDVPAVFDVRQIGTSLTTAARVGPGPVRCVVGRPVQRHCRRQKYAIAPHHWTGPPLPCQGDLPAYVLCGVPRFRTRRPSDAIRVTTAELRPVFGTHKSRPRPECQHHQDYDVCFHLHGDSQQFSPGFSRG